MTLNWVVIKQTPALPFHLPLCKFPPTTLQEIKSTEWKTATFIICFGKVGRPAWNGLATETILAVTGAVREIRRRAEVPRPRWESRSSVSSPKGSSPSREPGSELRAQGSVPHSPRTSATTLPGSSAHCRATDLVWTAQTERAASAVAPGSQPPPSGLPFLSPGPSSPPRPRSGLNKDIRACSLPQPPTGVSAKHHPGHVRADVSEVCFPGPWGAEKKLVWQGSRRNERGPSLPQIARPEGGAWSMEAGRGPQRWGPRRVAHKSVS